MKKFKKAVETHIKSLELERTLYEVRLKDYPKSSFMYKGLFFVIKWLEFKITIWEVFNGILFSR